MISRRNFSHFGLTVLAGVPLIPQSTWALSLADITTPDATQALRLALERAAQAALAQLGVPDGFLGNPQVRIPLPPRLQDAAQTLRWMGQGDALDQLVTAMNRAAEAAIPLGRELVVQAVQGLTVQDAKGILQGGDTAVTDYFAGKTRDPLTARLLPIVRQTTDRVGLAQQYNQVAGKAVDLGLLSSGEARVEDHVTARALQGLYSVIGEQEQKIRSDPVGTGSALIGRVFGTLK